MFFVFKQKTAYELRISDWSSDVCSSDLHVMPEVDGVVRRIPAVVVAADRLVPALAFEAARVTSGGSSYLLDTSPVIRALSLRFGDTVMPLGPEGGLWLAWDAVHTIPRISAATLIDAPPAPEGRATPP